MLDLTYLQFGPDCGCLGPGETIEAEVICHGASDGQHHSIVKVRFVLRLFPCLSPFVVYLQWLCVILSYSLSIHLHSDLV